MYYLGMRSHRGFAKVVVFLTAKEAWEAAISYPVGQVWPLSSREVAIDWLREDVSPTLAEMMLRAAENVI